MKRQILSLSLIMSIAMIMFSACNDDDVKVETLAPATYTDSNGLALTYSGMEMLGKQASFTPDAQDPSKATLTLSGVELQSKSGLGGATGVIPGMSTLTLALNDLKVENGQISFEGTENINSIAISYKGSASSSNMNLDLTVAMPQNELVGKTFTLAAPADWTTTPIYVDWQADPFPLGDSGSWEIQGAISMILSMAKIEEKTIPQMLTGVLNEITFLADGNIQATYKDALTDTEWKTSPLNLAMYTVSNGKVNVFLNLAQIAKISGADLQPILDMIEGFISGVNLGAGIPLAYTLNEKNGMNIYLDTEFLLPILKTVKPYFEDEALVNSIVELLKSQAGEMGPLVEVFLKPVLVAFPNIVDTTTKVELGLSLVMKE